MSDKKIPLHEQVIIGFQEESSAIKIKQKNEVNIVTENGIDKQLSIKLDSLETNSRLQEEIIKVEDGKENESSENRIVATETIEVITKKIVDSGIDLEGLTADEILQKLGGYDVEPITRQRQHRGNNANKHLTYLQKSKILRAIEEARLIQKKTLVDNEVDERVCDKEVIDSLQQEDAEEETLPPDISSRNFPPSTILFITFNNSVFVDNQEQLQQKLEPFGIQPIFQNYPDHQEQQGKEVTKFVIKCAINSWMAKKKFSIIVSADQEYPTSMITAFLGDIRFFCDKNSIEIIVARFGVYKESRKDIETRCYYAKANDTIFSKSLEPETTEIMNLIVLFLYKFVSVNASEFIIDLCNDAKNDHVNHGFCNCYIASTMIDNEIWSSVEHYVQAQRFTDAEIRAKIRKAPTSNEALFIVQQNLDLQRTDWNDEFRLRLIRQAVYEKFIQHSPLRYKLLATSANEFKLTYANLSNTTNCHENERLKECVDLASMQESDLTWYNNLLLEIRNHLFEHEVNPV
ncbi:13555_t:CDS:2 [Ambispora leptoticha]|uniref:13555_t:CDS:1 n=1 Tax=Ambispora leptoticha TaxID=144679 RepID=A0A9N8WDX5_9GLOM|nr:13555_t:CDS:2 [Ambispora leptoticha]